MGCVKHMGGCCGPVIVCRRFLGCFSRPVGLGVTINVTGPGDFDEDYETDADGKVCFEPPTSGTYYWSFSGNDDYAPWSGSFAFTGSPSEGDITLGPALGRFCTCDAQCEGARPLPETLYLTSTKWGSTTLVYNATTLRWEGSISGWGDGCDDGMPSPFTINYAWDCSGVLTMAVLTCCKVVSIDGNAYLRFLPGGTSSLVSLGATQALDCELIDLTYDIGLEGNELNGPIPFGCLNSLGAPAARTTGAWGFWSDAVNLVE